MESIHSKDSDCTVDPETMLCSLCGVYHSDPCPECAGRGFHIEGCSLSDATPRAQGRSYEIDPAPGGWKLTLKEDGIEMGGGFFPEEDYCEAMDEGAAWNEVEYLSEAR